MTINRNLGSVVGAAMGLAALTGTAYGQDVKGVGYQVPSIETATAFGQPRKYDGITEIAGAESTIKYYRKSDGTIFATISIGNREGKERIWAYSIDTDGKPPFEYKLILNDKGDFVRVPEGSSIETPGWILRHYFG